MQRNISITEFINSLKMKDSLFQNTLKYLYNADSQNGLYMFKTPLGSGKSTLRDLLLLYRISKLATIPTSDYYAIDFFDENVGLATGKILEYLNCSDLFIECESGTAVLEYSEIDKMHIYYHVTLSNNQNSIQFGKNIFLMFRRLADVFRIVEIGSLKDGDRGFVIPSDRVDTFANALAKPSRVVVHAESPALLPNVKFVFENVVKEKKYKHEKSMSIAPIQISLRPFAMFDVNLEILKDLDCNLIEFNDYDTILVESPQTAFNKKQVLDIEPVNVSHVLSDFGYALKKEVLPIAANLLSNKTRDFEEIIVNEENESILKKDLADVFGLVENWDYVKEGQKIYEKEVSEHEILIEQIVEMRKQKNYSILDNWDKKPIQLRTLLANQAKYMKVLPEHLMISLGKLVALNYTREAICCKTEEILDIIEKRYCKFVKQSKEYENSLFDEKTGLRLKVAKTSNSFGKLKASHLDIQFLNITDPECIKDFDTVGVLVPICLSEDEEKIGIFGVTFNGDDLF